MNISAAHERSVSLSTLDGEPTPICCCSFLDETLDSNQHLSDCELLHWADELTLPSGSGDTCVTEESPRGATDSAARKRKRESMARLRQKLRESICLLQEQQRGLVQELRRKVDEFNPDQQSTSSNRMKLRQAYFELVKEQLALQDEQQTLDSTWEQKATYERLVVRELDRMKEAARMMKGEVERDE